MIRRLAPLAATICLAGTVQAQGSLTPMADDPSIEPPQALARCSGAYLIWLMIEGEVSTPAELETRSAYFSAILDTGPSFYSGAEAFDAEAAAAFDTYVAASSDETIVDILTSDWLFCDELGAIVLGSLSE